MGVIYVVKCKNLVRLDGQGKPQSQGFIDEVHDYEAFMASHRLLMVIQVPETCPTAQMWEETQSCMSNPF